VNKNRDYNNYVYDENETVPDRHRSFTKEINQTMSHLDLSVKVRDIERKFIDLVSNLDRKFQAFVEENPQKLMRYMKVE